jgi:2-polyprenyl-3-methyl-5-hydroxy-6-metoxy-1,4-benzoquinol methylase
VSHPERIVPDETEPGIVALHLKRYEFARQHCVGKHVLDAGCGVGYGSAYLGEVARHVIGMDASAAAIEYARERYAAENVVFLVGDVLDAEVSHPFDVVCAFEVIEHLRDAERFVAKTRRLVKDDGVFIASTPRAEVSSRRPENPFHEREFTAPEFERLLHTSFAHVSVYGQRRVRTTRHRALQRLDVLGLRRRVPFVRRASRLVTGTASMDAVSTAEIEISADGLDDATELVAVCRP